ncbi:hypothetical protein ACJRO7_014045 [Eucalyptus globulus]|uniref:CCHC-type domain-containing protein n=1 Tax=Eucalyptus globulus TaxID=34317 RepID=A0ABD3KZX5_EUCGL
MHDSETLASLRRNSKGKHVVALDARDTPQASRGASLRRRLEDWRDGSPNSHEVREVNQRSFPLSDFEQAMIHWYRQAKELSGDGATGSYTFAQFREAKPPWTRKIEGIFEAEDVPEDKKVNFASRYLEGEAEHWWKGMRPALGDRGGTIAWEDFKQAFNAQFFPVSFQVKMKSDFIHISQGDSMMSRFAEQYVSNEQDKADHFQRGLRYEIGSALTPLALTSYKDVLERAIRVEQKILERDEQGVPQHKKLRSTVYQYSGAGGSRKRKAFNQLGKPRIQNNPGPCTTCGRRHSGPCYCKRGACFTYGKMGHMARDCPAQKNAPGDSRVCFVCGQLGHRAYTCSMRKTAPPVDRPQEGQQRQRMTGKVFTMTGEDAAASNTVFASNISIASQPAYALFDPGATHSFTSIDFAKKLDVLPELLKYELCIDTPTGDFLIADCVFKNCLLRIDDVPLLVDLVALDIRDFDVILGMDWLSKYHATADCYSKKVIFRPPNQPEFSFSGSYEVMQA